MTAPYAMHHTGLTVSDLERSLAFYRDGLGMTVVMQQEKQGGYLAHVTGYPGAHALMAQLEYAPGSHRLELFQYLVPEGGRSRPEPRDVGITHVCLLVDDLRELCARLAAAGLEFFSAPAELESGANKGGLCVYVRDPDGIVLELFQAPSAVGP